MSKAFDIQIALQNKYKEKRTDFLFLFYFFSSENAIFTDAVNLGPKLNFESRDIKKTGLDVCVSFLKFDVVDMLYANQILTTISLFRYLNYLGYQNRVHVTLILSFFYGK